MNIKFFFLFFFSFFLVCSCSLVAAIGISPGKMYVNYVDGEIIPLEIRIINSGNSNKVQMYKQGWLAEYVSLSEEEFLFNGERIHAISGILTLPPYETITEYGPQRVFIGARDISIGDGGTISASAAIKMWVQVDIPFPGKYARIHSLTAKHILKGENAQASFVVLNRGTNPLSDAKITLSLADFEGRVLDSVEFTNVFIPVDQNKTIRHEFFTQNYDSGIYTITGTFFYDDGNSLDATTTFFIGSTDVILTDYSKSLSQGTINKINLTLQSIWGSPLKNIRLSIIADGKTTNLPVLDLSPFEKQTIEGFIETPITDVKTLNATLRMFIPVQGDIVVQKDIPLTFTILELPRKENPFFASMNTTTLLFGVFVVLLLLLVLNVFFFRKKATALPLKKGKESSKNK